MKKRAVVLLSGGLDSTTSLAYAKAQGFDCYALSFDYGQKQKAELKAAKKIAEYFSVKEHQIVQLALNNLVRSALVSDDIVIPDYSGDGEIPITYVPARNTIFFSIALGWAEVLEADAIFSGVSSTDYSGYPDCRPEYIAAFQTMANLATKRGVEGNPIKIETPLTKLNKAQTIKLGQDLGVDYSLAVSCYRADDEGLACGTCDSCVFRKKGFAELGANDPTRYVIH
jgi:7-cyano-7-deazaguanine synthase